MAPYGGKRLELPTAALPGYRATGLNRVIAVQGAGSNETESALSRVHARKPR